MYRDQKKMVICFIPDPQAIKLEVYFLIIGLFACAYVVWVL